MPTASAADLDLALTGKRFQALSDETRLAVLAMLRGGERCVCELQDALDVAQSRLSFHLKVLREADLVRDRKEGRWSYYSLVPETLEAVHDAVRVLGTSTKGARDELKIFGRCCG